METSSPSRPPRPHVAPTSTPGHWCAGFGVLFLVAIAIELAIAASQRAGQPDNLWMRGAAFVAVASIVAGLLSGVVAMTRRHDRSPLVLAVVGAGALVTLFELGELVMSD